MANLLSKLAVPMVLAAISCKSGADSNLRLDPSELAPEGSFPEVVPLIRSTDHGKFETLPDDLVEVIDGFLYKPGELCTGTFVSDTTVITTASCVNDGHYNYLVSDRVVVAPTRKLIHPDYRPDDPVLPPNLATISNHDVAVLIFPATDVPHRAHGTPAAFKLGQMFPWVFEQMRSRSLPPEKQCDGLEVTAVGFGSATEAGSESLLPENPPRKHVARGRIYDFGGGVAMLSVWSPEVRTANSSVSPSWKEVGIAAGDYGGPIYWNNTLVAMIGKWRDSPIFGVTVPAIFRMVDLTNSSNRMFLQDAVDKEGAAIIGLPPRPSSSSPVARPVPIP